MKIIAMINSVSNPQKAYREVTVEGDDYKAAYQSAKDALAEDDRLLSVRMP